MQGFAFFRLPYGHQSGFVVAPFSPSEDEPILLIHDDHAEPSTDVALPELQHEQHDCKDREDYHNNFASFHSRLLHGDFSKLVLSRSIVLPRTEDDKPMTLFRKACQFYPRMFIALIYTPQSGLWMTATPEVLLSGVDSQWQTMALAGTMPYADDIKWSEKNIEEQRYVATYIVSQLERFTHDAKEEGPYTARAGHLAHLRSDFRFTLKKPSDIGSLLKALHPTPAVCGLPKEEAFRLICQQEHHARSYYSGFMGPLRLALSEEETSNAATTHLFVTLRCMQVFRNACRLYAGGGLLKDSVEEQEWQETETKLDTMRRVIAKTE